MLADPSQSNVNNSSRDDIFARPSGWGVGSFVFDQRVASVFDDMAQRSIPGYQAIQLLLADLAIRCATQDGLIFDLGCSTGETIKAICARKSHGLKIRGFDNSEAMVEKCRLKMQTLNTSNSIKIVCADLNSNIFDSDTTPDVVILCLVLQFIAPEKRLPILRNIWQNLPLNGTVLIVEKISQPDAQLDDLFTDYYHYYKREMGYSDLEVAMKRDALENVLIPLTAQENRELLENSGFRKVATFFQWINFVGFLAVK